MVRKFKVRVNGKEYTVEVEELGGAQSIQSVPTPEPVVENETKSIQTQSTVEEKTAPKQEAAIPTSGAKVVAPMSGIVLKILVSAGQKINSGDKVAILEAMKMENEIISEFSGTVKNVLVKEGDNVDTGQVLIELE
ncbi:glutaconyl-CoA decarboxylase subunit gamma [Thermosipho africanus H17ap60334]|uniref:biotin/lipoyl-containing protein n=1 Tax=Thermosipho africanus TaxID=2421 RepID=UPI00028C7EA2|nr:biotin/lipoyl-containing protein [Thermosipho africanus]EKF49870.1 glutaconyl-CoA decarboxylase subunit gamma [Thermosipho africanus H17ap60334]